MGEGEGEGEGGGEGDLLLLGHLNGRGCLRLGSKLRLEIRHGRLRGRYPLCHHLVSSGSRCLLGRRRLLNCRRLCLLGCLLSRRRLLNCRLLVCRRRLCLRLCSQLGLRPGLSLGLFSSNLVRAGL